MGQLKVKYAKQQHHQYFSSHQKYHYNRSATLKHIPSAYPLPENHNHPP